MCIRDRPYAVLDLLGPIGTTHDEYLMVSIVVQNLVEIDAVVSITWKFQYFARLAWKRLFTPQKLGFSGDFTPKMRSNVNETPNRHILAWVRVVWAIKRENPSSRLTCRWVHEKRVGINKKKFRYISPVCPEAPRRRICTKFGAAAGAADVITCTKFFGDRSRGVCSVGGRKLPSPVDKASRR